MINDKNCNNLIVKITELSAIKEQSEIWYDSAGLVAEVFQNIML